LGVALINLISYLLFVYGLAILVSSELIFVPVVELFKDHDKLYYHLTCPKCLSISIGFVVSVFGFTVVNPFIDPILAYAFTSITATVLSSFEEDINIDFINPE
jgi:hypothetical protein